MLKIIGIEQDEKIVKYLVSSDEPLLERTILDEIAQILKAPDNSNPQGGIPQDVIEVHSCVDFILQKHNLLKKEGSSMVYPCFGPKNIVKELDVFVDLKCNRSNTDGCQCKINE